MAPFLAEDRNGNEAWNQASDHQIPNVIEINHQNSKVAMATISRLHIAEILKWCKLQGLRLLNLAILATGKCER